MWLKTIDVEEQKRFLKCEHWDDFQNAVSCIYCGESFNDERKPVFDHSHTHNVYNGAACSSCNLLASKQRNINCFFHNAPYDANLLLEHLNFNKFKEGTWSASMVGQKLKLISTNRIELLTPWFSAKCSTTELYRSRSYDKIKVGLRSRT